MAEGILKCKTCGNVIDLSSAVNGVVECDSCFNRYTVPKKEASPAALSFLRQGEHDLDTGRFDDAYKAYEKAKEYDDKEPEAYWGMALAEFKVQYLKDVVNSRLQPICHEFTNKVFVKNKNFQAALKHATDEQKSEYKKKAEDIDHIRAEFLKFKQQELNYDCFLCVKVSNTDSEQVEKSKKNWTSDARNAEEIYELLKRRGFAPFFSEREIRGRAGADYEAMILYALYTCETMLVVCNNDEYLQTPWVKNEFTRFKELVNNKEKESDSLTIVYEGSPIEKLPGFIGKIQGIDYGRSDASADIVEFVKNHTPFARAKREESKRKNEKQTQEIFGKIEKQEKFVQQLEEQLKNVGSNTVAGASSTVKTLLVRANQEMEMENFEKATNFLEMVLERAPENSDAWWGLFLCDFKNRLGNKDLSYESIGKIVGNKNFGNAKRYASGDCKVKIDAFREKLKDRLTQLEDDAETEKDELETAKNELETEIKKSQVKKSKLDTLKQQRKKPFSDKIKGISLQEKELKDLNDTNQSRAERCYHWDLPASFGFFMFGVLYVILIIGIFIAQLVVHFKGIVYENGFLDFLFWGKKAGAGIGKNIPFVFGPIDISWLFVIVLSALAGIINAGLISLALLISFLIVSGIICLIHNIKVSKINAVAGKSNQDLEEIREELKGIKKELSDIDERIKHEKEIIDAELRVKNNGLNTINRNLSICDKRKLTIKKYFEDL